MLELPDPCGMQANWDCRRLRWQQLEPSVRIVPRTPYIRRIVPPAETVSLTRELLTQYLLFYERSWQPPRQREALPTCLGSS